MGKPPDKAASATGSLTKPLTIPDALRLAAPASLASMATPLLGLVDVWALGHSSRPLDIAAIGLGAVIFSIVYWTFGFIRMSVAGLGAQAHGRGDEAAVRAVLAQGIMIGLGAGVSLLVLHVPIGWLAFQLLGTGSNASAETFQAAQTYYSIRIWGAPFALGTYALFGWLTARGRTDYLMVASLTMTGVNIALDYWFVVGMGHGAAGVAYGTLIAELAGFAIAALFCVAVMKRKGGIRSYWHRNRITDRTMLRRTISVNFDIFLRTFLLAGSFAWFVQRGSAFGDVTLAANQALMQLFLLTGLALDGTAIAAETLVGQAIGANGAGQDRRLRLANAIRLTTIPAIITALLFALTYAMFRDPILGTLTPDGAIRAAARTYFPWVLISPLIVVLAFQLDGIFIGATRAREMRNGMIASTAVLIPTTILFADWYGNHGLWAAFSLYFLLRAATLGVYLPRVLKTDG